MKSSTAFVNIENEKIIGTKDLKPLESADSLLIRKCILHIIAKMIQGQSGLNLITV